MKNKIKYKDLSWPIKVAFIVAWIDVVYFAIAFAVGFFYGFTA